LAFSFNNTDLMWKTNSGVTMHGPAYIKCEKSPSHGGWWPEAAPFSRCCGLGANGFAGEEYAEKEPWREESV